MGNELPTTSADIVKHEYGHTQQLDKMGWKDYMVNVVVPSVTAYHLDKQGILNYDYYGSPWEADADALGGVTRTSNNVPWPTEAYKWYFELVELVEVLL